MEQFLIGFVQSKIDSLLEPDPADLPFLEIAILGGADALVTGNLKHFRPTMGQYRMNVYAPHEFVKKRRRRRKVALSNQ